MRNLTIKRTKSFVASLAAMKVYIEDPAGEITIIDTPCRKLGDLKNGEEKTFQIENTELKVFVIAGEMSRNYCNDFYPIPAGEDDVFLSGKNSYNPSAGNPFRFDGVEDAAVLQNRKRGTRRGLLILIPALIIGIIVGFVIGWFLIGSAFSESSEPSKPGPQKFTVDEMSITLTDEFVLMYMDDGTPYYGSPDAYVFILKDEELDEYGVHTLDVYAQYLQTSEPSAKLRKSDGLTYFEYTTPNPDNTKEFYYCACLFQTKDAFWDIMFATIESKAEEYQPKFLKWAKSVEFSD